MSNLADHLKASAEIRQHIEDADALARKLGAMLSKARDTLETLKVFAPNDRFRIDAPYHLRTGREASDASLSMNEIIKRQCAAISETLGDRAS